MASRRRSGRIRVDTPDFPAAEVPSATPRRSRRATGTPGVASGRVSRRSRGAPAGGTTRTTDRNNNTAPIDQPSDDTRRASERVSSRSNRRSSRITGVTERRSGRRARNEEPMEVDISRTRPAG